MKKKNLDEKFYFENKGAEKMHSMKDMVNNFSIWGAVLQGQCLTNL